MALQASFESQPMFFTQRTTAPAVCGKARIEDAKITGITPPALTFERHVRGLSAHHAPAYHALGVLHRNAALAALHQDDEGHHRDHHRDQHDQRDGAPVVDREHVLVNVGDRVRADPPRCR